MEGTGGMTMSPGVVSQVRTSPTFEGVTSAPRASAMDEVSFQKVEVGEVIGPEVEQEAESKVSDTQRDPFEIANHLFEDAKVKGVDQALKDYSEGSEGSVSDSNLTIEEESSTHEVEQTGEEEKPTALELLKEKRVEDMTFTERKLLELNNRVDEMVNKVENVEKKANTNETLTLLTAQSLLLTAELLKEMIDKEKNKEKKSLFEIIADIIAKILTAITAPGDTEEDKKNQNKYTKAV